MLLKTINIIIWGKHLEDFGQGDLFLKQRPPQTFKL